MVGAGVELSGAGRARAGLALVGLEDELLAGQGEPGRGRGRGRLGGAAALPVGTLALRGEVEGGVAAQVDGQVVCGVGRGEGEVAGRVRRLEHVRVGAVVVRERGVGRGRGVGAGRRPVRGEGRPHVVDGHVGRLVAVAQLRRQLALVLHRRVVARV